MVEDTYDRTADVGRTRFPKGLPVRLRGRDPLSLAVLYSYRTIHDPAGWSAQLSGYSYQVYAQNDREIVAFHWHPDRGPVATPHAHFKQLNDPIPMGKVHVPTGWISLPTVVRFLIEELAVEPLRPDWRTVLDEAERNAGGPSLR